MTGNDIVRRPRIEATARFRQKVYTVAQAEALTNLEAGEECHLSDDVGGYTPAYYDGTNWRRVADRAIAAD